MVHHIVGLGGGERGGEREEKGGGEKEGERGREREREGERRREERGREREREGERRERNRGRGRKREGGGEREGGDKEREREGGDRRRFKERRGLVGGEVEIICHVENYSYLRCSTVSTGSKLCGPNQILSFQIMRGIDPWASPSLTH